MCYKTKIKNASWIIPIVSGLAATIATVVFWIWGTSGAVAREKTAVRSDINSIQKDVSKLNLSVEGLKKDQHADHDTIIRFEVRQENIFKALSEIKELIKEKHNP